MLDMRHGRLKMANDEARYQAMYEAEQNAKYQAIYDAEQAAKPVPFGEQLDANIKEIPRQLGLTARHAINGIGNTADFLATPIRAGLNAIMPDNMQAHTGAIQGLSDKLGLPQPKNSLERVVGDASSMLVGGAGLAGVAGKAAPLLNGTNQKIAQLLSTNNAQTMASSAAAGGAGGYTRETGGGDNAQLAAALIAGVGAPMAVSGAQKLAGALKSGYGNMTNPQNNMPNIDININNAIKQSGLNLGDLPQSVAANIRQDVGQALKVNGNLNPDAVRRLADYHLTGATPTNARLTLDPSDVSRQNNLAKLGINSNDKMAQALGRVENTNNNQFINGLNEAGANTTDNALTGGQKIMDALSKRNATAKGLIDERYQTARATDGRSANLDPHAFANQANNALDEALLGGKLPSDVRNLLNGVSQGKIPLTVDTAEQFKTRIGDLQRSSIDKAERLALGHVRSALDNTPLVDGQGQQAIDAFNKARGLNKAWMGIVEKTPALQAVRDGIEPDKFVRQFITSNGSKANLGDVKALHSSIKSSPEAMDAVKTQIAAHLKKQALNGAADEVGNFSQSAYNKALNAIGDDKLNLFFPKEDVQQLRAIGRVSSYEQFQPKGGATNNSNSAAAIGNILERIGGSSLLRKIPLGNMLAEPIQNISVGMQAKQALNSPKALAGALLAKPKQPSSLMLSPAAFVQDNNRK